MASGVKWLFELYDKVSGPSKAMAKSLERVDKTVDALDKHSKHAQGALDTFAHHVDKANQKVGKELLEGLAEKFAVFNIGLQLAEKFLETVVEIGAELAHEAVEAANFGRETEIVFTSLLGSADKAHEMAEYIDRFGDAVGKSHREVRDLVDSLVRAGFEGDNLNIVMNAASDVEALTFGKHKAQELVDAFQSISEKGQLTSRSLMQFQGMLGEGGIDKLAKKLGFATHGIKALQKQLEETPVDAFKGEQAILDVIEQMSGGKLGATAEKMSHELPQIIQKFRNHVEELFTTVGKSAAWEKFLGFAEKFAEAFNPATESGKKFEAAIDRVLVGVEDLLDQVSQPGTLDNIINGMTDFAHSAATVAQAVISITEGLAKVIGWWRSVPEPLKVLLNPLGSMPGKAWDAGAFIAGGGKADFDPKLYGHSDAFYRHGGEDDPSGMSVAGSEQMAAIGADAIDGLEKGAREQGEMHSPSRVMMEVGADAFEGFRRGVADSKSSSSAGAQLLIQLQVVVQGTGSNAEEQGRIAGRAALSELQPAFDSLAEQLGLAPA